MSEDSVRIGTGHVEIKPELDQAAVARVKAALAASYSDDTASWRKEQQNRLAHQLGFARTGNNEILQASAKLEAQRSALTKRAEQDRMKTFQDSLRAFQYVENLKTQHMQKQSKERQRIEEEESRRSRNGGFWTLFSGGRAFQQAQAALVGTAVVNAAPLTAGILALGSAFATTTAASAAWGLAVTGQIAEVTSVMKELQKGTMTLDQLPASYQKLIPEIKNFQTVWHQFLANTRGPIFEDFGRGMQIAEKGLTKITPLVNAFSHGVGGVLDKLDKFGDGPEVAGFLKTAQEYAPAAINSLTTSALNFGRGFLNILSGLAPAGQSMLTTLEHLSAGFARWSASLQNSPGFQQFVQYAAANGPKILDIFANLVTLAGKLVTALAPIGAVAINLLQGLSKLAAVIDPSAWQAVAIVLATVYIRYKSLAIIVTVTEWIAAAKVAWAEYSVACLGASAANATVAESSAATAATTKVSASAMAALNPVTLAVAAALFGVKAGWDAFNEGADKASDMTVLFAGVAVALGDALRKLTGRDKQYIWRSLVADSQTAADAIIASQTAAAQTVANAYQAAMNAAHFGTVDLTQQALGAIAEGLAQKYDTLTQSVRATAKAKAQEAVVTEQSARANIEAARAVTQAQHSYAQSKQSVIDAERAVRDAHFATIDAMRSYRDAQAQTKQAVLDLAQARADAATQLRDQEFAETNSTLALEDARRRAAAFGLYGGPLVSDYDMQKAQAAEALAEAEAKNNDTTAQGVKLRQQGINGNPQVLQAQKALIDSKYAEEKARRGVADAQYNEKKATLFLKEAQYQEAQARQSVADAIYRQNKTLADGKQSRADAHQATLDAITAEKNAKRAYDDATSALMSLTSQTGLAKKAQQDLAAQLAKKLTMDAGNVPAQLQDIATYTEAIHKLSANTSLTWQQAWAYAYSEITGKGNPTGNNPGAYHHAATGGGIFGPGTGTSDSIPAMLSNGEHVLTAAEVAAAGGHQNIYAFRKMLVQHRAAGGPILPAPKGLQDLLTGGAGNVISKTLATLGFRKFATGGEVALAGDPSNPFFVPMLLGAMNGYANGGAVSSTLGFLASIANKIPYIFGAVGPSGYDCSGLVGEAWARLTGHPSYRRYFVTANEGAWAAANGFRPGRGEFTIGYNDHHTVGRLAGHSFEAAHTGTKMRFDNGTTPESMPHVLYLPSMGGTPSTAAPVAVLPGGVGPGSAQYITLPSLFRFPGGRYALPGIPAGATNGPSARPTSGGNLMGWINTALAAAHAPASWAGGPGQLGMYTLVQRESGGNPFAVNRTDSNWLAGHPSVGLAQVIGPTFRSHAGPYANTPPMAYGVSEDPVANLYASIKYIMGRYGHLPQQADPSRHAKGYRTGGPVLVRDQGGPIPPGDWMVSNRTGGTEWVLPPDGKGKNAPVINLGDLRVFIGNEEVREIVKVEIQDRESGTIQTLMAR